MKIYLGIIVVLLLSGCWETTRNAEHNGQITAIEQSGAFWKTWTVYVKTDISSSQEDHYCVEDETLIPQLKNISDTRQKVTLIYRAEMFIAPWRCGQSEIITGVKA